MESHAMVYAYQVISLPKSSFTALRSSVQPSSVSHPAQSQLKSLTQCENIVAHAFNQEGGVEGTTQIQASIIADILAVAWTSA